jgi:putative effector of murein hydrolase
MITLQEGAALLLLTIVAYASARAVHVRFPSPITVPVFLATAAIIFTITQLGIDYLVYRTANEIVLSTLSTATVALAIPLYKNRIVLARHALPIVCGLLAGTLTTVLTSVGLAAAAGLSSTLVASLSIKSSTAAVAVGIAPILGGDPTITAIFVVSTGMIGAVLGPLLLDRIGVSEPVARGVAIGTISHAIGTAQIVQETELAGAVSGVATVIAALLTAAIAPALIATLLERLLAG